jgi:ribose/xylose/arabinose/galactoside ABC-type transport system permease subunit
MRVHLLGRLGRWPTTPGLVFGVALFVANLIALPSFVGSGQLTPTLGTLAPFAIAGMASTPAFLSGGGGIDLSIAPLMGLINIVLVTQLLGTPLGTPVLAIPILLALGAAVGATNGVLIARLRFPPVIATLGTFFVLSGLDLSLVPNPVTRWPAASGRFRAPCSRSGARLCSGCCCGERRMSAPFLPSGITMRPRSPPVSTSTRFESRRTPSAD